MSCVGGLPVLQMRKLRHRDGLGTQALYSGAEIGNQVPQVHEHCIRFLFPGLPGHLLSEMLPCVQMLTHVVGHAQLITIKGQCQAVSRLLGTLNASCKEMLHWFYSTREDSLDSGAAPDLVGGSGFHLSLKTELSVGRAAEGGARGLRAWDLVGTCATVRLGCLSSLGAWERAPSLLG